MDRADRVMDRVKVDGPLEHFRVDVNVTKNDNLVNTVHFHPFPSSTSDLNQLFHIEIAKIKPYSFDKTQILRFESAVPQKTCNSFLMDENSSISSKSESFRVFSSTKTFIFFSFISHFAN